MTPLDYLALGWHLIPLHRALPDGRCTCGRNPCPDKPGKHPRTEHGQKDASNDPRQVEEWTRQWPELNWGVLCHASGFAAIDVDPRDGGDKTFADLVAAHGPLPPGPVQATGGGGSHYLVLPPAGRQLRGTLGRFSGIQVKYNGYIVIEPSNHESGHSYHWNGTLALPVPAVPDSWLETLCRPISTPQTRNFAAPDDATRLESALAAISSADDYETWITVGMGIKAAVGESGFALWDEWSRQSPKYNPASMARKWASFKPDGGITGATIYGLATKEGWRPARLHVVAAQPEDIEAPPHDDSEAPEYVYQEVIDLEPPVPAQQPRNPAAERPTIKLSTEMEAVINQAEDAILNLPRRNLYQRSGRLVRITKDSQPPDGVTRPAGAVAIKPCPIAHLQELCSRAAVWAKYDKRQEDWVPTLPPTWVIQALEARGQWRFPPILSIISAPTIRPDGTILDTPGYDERTGLLYLPGGITFPHIPTTPTRADANAALASLAEPFVDFPFTSRSDKSAALAAVLAIICRAAIPGPVPLFAIRATTAGTGKSLLADLISIISTGRLAPRWSETDAQEEERKRLLSLAIEGDPILVLDNVTRPIGSGSLDMAITAGYVKDRLLGVTESAQAPWRCVVMATGNNLQVKGDMARRVQPIDLDAGMERPEERAGWKYPDIIRWTIQERPRLVQQALIAVRAYACAGWPAVDALPIGSFEDFCRVVRAAIIWAGWPDPAEGRERIRQDSDPELDALREVIHAWHAHYQDRPMVLAAVGVDIEDEYITTRTSSALRVALEEATRFRKGPLAARVGYYLRRHKGRIVDGLRLDSKPSTGCGVQWVVYPSRDGTTRHP